MYICLNMWAFHFLHTVGTFPNASNVQVNSYQYTDIIERSTRARPPSKISPGAEITRDCNFGFRSWYSSASSCASLWDLPLFTPVMCMNSADRPPVAVNAECVRVLLPREKRGCQRKKKHLNNGNTCHACQMCLFFLQWDQALPLSMKLYASPC